MSAATQQCQLLNQECLCLPVNPGEITDAIGLQWPQPPLAAVLADRQHLFANSAVLLAHTDVQQMTAVVGAVESAVRLPGYRQQVVQRAPWLAERLPNVSPGLFMSYDFHLTAAGPALIEVNTNAGGAGLVLALQQVVDFHERHCGHGALVDLVADAAASLAATVRREWQHHRQSVQPELLAIVDVDPQQQYLYPDMLLLQSQLQQQGVNARIVALGDLRYQGDTLWAGTERVDMVYNRVTDFDLAGAEVGPLRNAYRDNTVVISPGPEHHALFANKRNLVLLSDMERLAAWGLSGQHLKTLARQPVTQSVSASNATELWRTRKDWFFKPTAGFGSRGAYRGSKLTRKVWQQILQADYVAQAMTPPAVRRLQVAAGSGQWQVKQLKYDLRMYTYAGSPLLLAARVYQGQTTNFRTPGGGFAPVQACS